MYCIYTETKGNVHGVLLKGGVDCKTELKMEWKMEWKMERIMEWKH